MPMHPDYVKIHKRFISQYGPEKGKSFYYAWLNKKGYDDSKAFPHGGEKKELICRVRGFEIKENEKEYHIEGLIATSHVDELDRQEDIEIPDVIPKETLEAFVTQIKNDPNARVMGIHHSEGREINPEYFGVADIVFNLPKVVELSDGEWGLYVDTVLLKDDVHTPEIINKYENGELNAFSITYDTNGFMTTDFTWIGDKLTRVLGPETKLFGYTGASNPVNPNAVAMGYGFKEFKELISLKKIEQEKPVENKNEEVSYMTEKESKEIESTASNQPSVGSGIVGTAEADAEYKEFLKEKKAREEKELLEKAATKIADAVLSKIEIKEKVLKDNTNPGINEVSFELKEFRDVINNPNVELKEQFRRAGAVCDSMKIDWQTAKTSPVETREFKHFGTNGRKLEFKGLGVTTNQNSDTDYLQSAAELQDVYDPVIYNALNQKTVTWNILAKDDYSKKGNNQVQFTLKTAANTSAAFYTGNAVSGGNVTRLKFQTKFKKLQVGVSVDGDMIAAARGGPVSDVFAQEVLDSTMDMLAVLNAALFAEAGAETVATVIGFEYITDSAGNTTLYSLTRSTTNKLSPASAGDTYINQSSTVISMTNLRAGIKQATTEGADEKNLVWITNKTQGNMLRGKFDDSRRMLTSKDTDFGFATDLFVDGVPVFEDKDCNTDDWWLIDLETHRVGIWIPPTIEKLGKTADSEDAFIKMYLATYNRCPRRMVQIYGCATS